MGGHPWVGRAGQRMPQPHERAISVDVHRRWSGYDHVTAVCFPVHRGLLQPVQGFGSDCPDLCDWSDRALQSVVALRFAADMERVRCMAIAGVVFVHRLLDGLMGLGAIYLGPVPGVPASRAGLHVGFHKRRRLVAEPVEQEARRAVTASLHSAGASLAARQPRWIQEAVCLHQIFVGKSAFSTQHGASTNAGNNQRQCRWLLRTIQRPPRDSAADAVHASAAPLREAGRAVQHAFAVSSFALMRGGRRAFAGLMLHRRESHLPPATDDNPCVVVTATTPRLTAAATRNTKVLCVPTWRSGNPRGPGLLSRALF